MSFEHNYHFNIPLLVISGPTASGKTDLAIEIAKEFNGEIVGADSMQIYKGMDIGTATPSKEELDGVIHHMINIVNPDEDYDVARYVKNAQTIITDIHSRGKKAIVSGGTGMYIRILLHGLQDAPPPNPEIRKELTARAEAEGWPSLHEHLKSIDEESAAIIHENDGVRILRALEVHMQTNRSIVSWQKEHSFSGARYPFRGIGLLIDKEELNAVINRRVDKMMEQGFVDEVKKLLSLGYDSSCKSMSGLGYKRIMEYLQNKRTLDLAIEQIKIDTRRFAKRQRTWFKKEAGFFWVKPNLHRILDLARRFYEDYQEQAE